MHSHKITEQTSAASCVTMTIKTLEKDILLTSFLQGAHHLVL